MLKIKAITIKAATVVWFVISFSGSAAFAFGNDREWVSGFGQGISESIITKGPGNSIYVTCDVGAGMNATGIRFMLAGRAPTGHQITLTFDNLDPEDYSIWEGRVPSDCRACASVFEDIVKKMKKHNSVHVRFENGDSTRFSLRGAARAIGKCPADLYR